MLANFPRFYLGLVLALTLELLTACAGSGFLTPYKAEVVQGNVITREQAALIQTGMTRTQVRDILGSPMVADIFHEDRWDYVFTIRRAGAPAQQRNVVARFEGDRLKSLEAPELPTERDFVALIDTARPAQKVPSLALSPDQIKALPAPAAIPSPVAQAPQGANRTYPPLEPR